MLVRRRRVRGIGIIGRSLLLVAALGVGAAAQNPIVLENQLPGTDPDTWYVAGPGDANIQGFATDISVQPGATVHFKIDTDATAYHIDIYRLGWYQGLGARLVGTGVVTATLPQVQPPPIVEVASAMTDCGNWAESAHWDVPPSAVSGIHIAKLTRDDATPGTSHVIFVVRDDASTSDLILQTSDSTWQAYNVYGGASTYPALGGAAPGFNHATKVSYNRPFDIRHADGSPGDDVFAAEYAMVRWIEANGYDVSYTTSIDSDRRGALLQQHRLFLSVGHDEYWSGPQRAHVTAARDAGVHLAFFSGNEVYWKIRYEPSIDGSNTPHRTLVSFKEGSLGENGCGAKCDPAPQWTGLWRDGCPPTYVGTDACQQESTLTGQYSWDGTIGAILVPATFKNLRFWRNTSIAALLPGQTATLGASSLGSEWDFEQPSAVYPPRRIKLSQTLLNGRTHHLSLYRADSGALVFGAGTIQWSWGLDAFHTFAQVPINADMQQATVNLFADMGIAAGSLQPGLVSGIGSSDTSVPASMITSPASGGTIASNGTLTIQGIAVDAGGGVVAGVEVSTDGGATWRAATGTAAWTFAWSPDATGAVTIHSRAFDDTLNIELAGTVGSPNVIQYTVTGPECPCTVFAATDGPTSPMANDLQPIEVGMKFQTDVNGAITALRYFKPVGATGVHVGNLWSAGGALLGQATFVGESASGWQEAALAAPVPVAANTTYVVSYFSPSGAYVATLDYFVQAAGTGLVHGLADGTAGANGVYHYGASALPTETFRSANYWVDVVFDDGLADTTPPVVTARTPAPGAVLVPTNSLVTVTFDEDLDPLTVSTATIELRDAFATAQAANVNYDALARRATLAPVALLAADATYTVVVHGGLSGPRVADLAGNVLAADATWSFTTAGVTAGPFAVFAPNAPSLLLSNDGQPLELGMKFRTLLDGVVTALRYVKPAGATGTRTGNLWTSAGVHLASAPFINETASGWQEVVLSTPVPVVAGTTYVVSYFSSSGDYVGTPGFFTQEVGNGLVRAIANGTDGPNGVYLYTPSSAFPNQAATSSNYYADVVLYADFADLTAPTVTQQLPAPGATAVATNTEITATFDEALDPSSVDAATFELRDGALNLVPAVVLYERGTGRARLLPAANLIATTTYTATLHGGAAGARIRDAAGNALAGDVVWTFTTASLPACPCTVFVPTAGPTDGVHNDSSPIELGMRFRADIDGLITSLRYFKPGGASGQHIGSVWTNGGTLLARATFTNETASGWQEVLLATPVPVTTGTSYVVSYFSASGDYVSTLDFFGQSVGSGLVHGLADGFDGPNGMFTYTAAPAFPTGAFRSSNYWVDVVLYRPDAARNETFGAGCPGTAGLVPELAAVGLPPLPTQPNATFGLALTNARPQSFAAIALGAAPASAAPCALLIDGLGQMWIVLTTAAGGATVPVPVPPSPSFLSMSVWLQGAVFDPNAVTSSLPGLALTRGLKLTIGNP